MTHQAASSASPDESWKDMPNEEALSKLNSSLEQGLSETEAKSRLAKYGLNTIEEKKQSALRKFLSFFWGPIPWMIEVAFILSGALERWPDFIVIGTLLIINALLGFWQEHKADNAIASLKQKLALQAYVLRDTKWKEIPADQLVPGDIIKVKLGNILPADLKLLDGKYLSVDQSALTGESLPVDKGPGEIAYSGAIAKKGEMTGIVIATAMDTFFGKTAKLISQAKTKSHLQKAIVTIGNFLIFSTLAIAAVLLAVSIYRLYYDVNDHDTAGQIIIFLLVLVIAGIPVALPAVLSVTMAIGATKMAKLKAIVSKLMAIEELAGMDLLCSDKTGTLTKNEIAVETIQPFDAKDKEDVVFHASIASDPNTTDPIDNAIMAELRDKNVLADYPIEDFVPFDPTSKKTEAKIGGKAPFIVYKGAAQAIIDLCQLDKEKADQIEQSVVDFAKRGMRALAVAKSDPNKTQFIFLGLLALVDPPRGDTKETIRLVKSMGINVKMVTGDRAEIAREIAKQIDMGSEIKPISDLEKNGKELDPASIEKAEGFAEVFPEHKFNIVNALQGRKHIVGMTGDGVNDAPALKQADIGIAVAKATDAARASADLILTQPGLNVIAKAIEESRRVFGRMKSYAIYRISETMRLLLFLLLAMIAFNDHPLTAIMVILIALLNDIPIMMIAYDNMRVSPTPCEWKMKEVFTLAGGLAIVGVISTFGLYWIAETYWHFDFIASRTLAFMAILCGGNLTIYLTRNEGWIWQKPAPEWKFFLATIFSQVIGTLFSVYGLGTSDFVGIGWKYTIYSWIYILVWFGICMLTKRLLYTFFHRCKKSIT